VRLGILGGSFDPPHLGHLLAASDAFEHLELERLLFVPAAAQPFKTGTIVASPADRMRMVELTVGTDARFEAERAELDRPGLSYSVDTLTELSARHPGASFFLLIGEDLAGQIATWRDAKRLAELASIVVLTRGDASGPPAAATGRYRRLSTRRVDISSTEIRARVRAGQSIHGFVTDAVADYIASTGLYR